MKKVAIVDKYDKGRDYSKNLPDIDTFDIYHLSTQNKKKLLVADIDIEFNPDEYDYVILVGAEATKKYAKVSVTSHQGYLVDNKFLPMIDPAMLVFKPELKSTFENSIKNIQEYILETKEKAKFRNCIGVQDDDQAETVLENILNLSRRPVALDTETSGLYPRDAELLGISIAHEITEGYYINALNLTEKCEELLQQIINKHIIVFQNAKFDMGMLEYHLNLDFSNKDVLDASTFEDTLVIHYLLDETMGSHGLKFLSIKYTDLGDYDRDLEVFKRDYCKKHKIKLADFIYSVIPFDIMYPYACKDAMATLELFLLFKPIIEKSKIAKAYDMLKRGTKTLLQIQENGVPFHKPSLLKSQEFLTKQIFDLEEQLYKLEEVREFEIQYKAKFNANSPKHLVFLFYELLRLKPIMKMTATGAFSVDAEVLDELAKQNPVAGKIKELKQAKKIKATYIDKVLAGLDADGRLRTNFNLTFTTSGRLSSSGKLNMQQLPRDNKIVKACIRAPEGYKIISQDLGTAEMYVAAVLSGDKNLMSVFKLRSEGKGADFHSTIAHMVFNLPCDVKDVKKLYPEFRQAAKAISFGILYGSGPAKVAESINDSGGNCSKDEAVEYINIYFSKFPKLKKWLDDNKKFIKTNGYIYSIFNRKRRLSNVFSPDPMTSSHELRSGINFLIQSVASDMNLLACIELQAYINNNNMKAQIFAMVHDSILALVPDNEIDRYSAISKSITQADYGCMIPGCPIEIDLEIGDSYAFSEHWLDD